MPPHAMPWYIHHTLQTILAGTSPKLRADAWRLVGGFLARAAQLPAGDPFGAGRVVLAELDRLFAGHGSSVGFVVRQGEQTTDRAPGRVRGWSPGYFLVQAGEEVRVAMTAEILRARQFPLDDVMQRKMRHAGRQRIHVSRGFRPGSSIPHGLEGAIFRRLRLVDRMTVHLPFSANVEGVVMVDRTRGRVFSRRDAHLLAALLPALVGPLGALARACGYLDCLEPLTPRERDVLVRLLTGAREKDMAAELGMSPNALHQRVKQIYAKYGVTSRPELMALWLGSRAPSTGEYSTASPDQEMRPNAPAA